MGKPVMIFEYQIQQNAQSQQVVSIPPRCISAAIQCPDGSSNNVFIGWNENATSKNTLAPGQAKAYGATIADRFLDRNKLRIGFDSTGSGGTCLISFLTEIEEDSIC